MRDLKLIDALESACIQSWPNHSMVDKRENKGGLVALAGSGVIDAVGLKQAILTGRCMCEDQTIPIDKAQEKTLIDAYHANIRNRFPFPTSEESIYTAFVESMDEVLGPGYWGDKEEEHQAQLRNYIYWMKNHPFMVACPIPFSIGADWLGRIVKSSTHRLCVLMDSGDCMRRGCVLLAHTVRLFRVCQLLKLDQNLSREFYTHSMIRFNEGRDTRELLHLLNQQQPVFAIYENLGPVKDAGLSEQSLYFHDPQAESILRQTIGV